MATYKDMQSKICRGYSTACEFIFDKDHTVCTVGYKYDAVFQLLKENYNYSMHGIIADKI